MHVDDFIDNTETDSYASWFLLLKRLPTTLQYKFIQQIKQYKLFCEYNSEKYQVTGASRMGDIFITKDFDRNIGYDKRVDIAKCINFTNK